MSDRDDFPADEDHYASSGDGSVGGEAGADYGDRVPSSQDERIAAAKRYSFATRYAIVLKQAEARLHRPLREPEQMAAFYYLDKVTRDTAGVGTVVGIMGFQRTIWRAVNQGWRLPMFLSWS